MKTCLFRAILKKYLRLLIAMLLVASLAFGLMTGMANGYLSLKKTLEMKFRELMSGRRATLPQNIRFAWREGLPW